MAMHIENVLCSLLATIFAASRTAEDLPLTASEPFPWALSPSQLCIDLIWCCRLSLTRDLWEYTLPSDRALSTKQADHSKEQEFRLFLRCMLNKLICRAVHGVWDLNGWLCLEKSAVI